MSAHQERLYDLARMRVLADVCVFVDIARTLPSYSFPSAVREVLPALVKHVDEYRGHQEELPKTVRMTREIAARR